MLKKEIVVGGYYKAKISGRIVTVKVLSISERGGSYYAKAGTSYRVLNLSSGRETTFRSAAKFRSVAAAPVETTQP